jgi:hypothetical protein
MDSAKIDAFLSTLCIQSLMMWVFTNIDGFNEHFLTVFISLLGDAVDIDSLQKRLQTIFLRKLRERLASGGYMLMRRFMYNVADETIAHDVSRDLKLWKDAFYKLKDEVRIEQNQRYTSLSWALENLGIFANSVQKYMTDFAKARGQRIGSVECTEHLANLKNDLQDMMDAYIIRKERDHYDMCGYDLWGPGESYFLCTSCMSRLKTKWSRLLDEWIDDQKFYNAFCADRAHDFSDIADDTKEKSRRDFVGKSKGRLREKERRLRKKGTLTRESLKELRLSRVLLQKA